MNTIKAFTAALSAFVLGAHADAALLVGVQGEAWKSDTQLSNLTKALDEINSRSADALFDVFSIDYPNGSTGSISDSRTGLSAFLGVFGEITSGTDFARLEDTAMRFTGQILITDFNDTWSLGSDDGFRLTVDNTIVGEHSGPRRFRFSQGSFSKLPGLYTFELIYFERQGKTGIEFKTNGQMAEIVAETPVPAAGVLMAVGLGVAAFRRRG